MKIIKRLSPVALCLGLVACGGGGGSSSGGGGGGGGSGPNTAPVFSSGATASVAENSAGTVYTATATDADGNALTYSLAAGGDSALFNINASSGAVSFKAAPNFEWPTDAGRNNVYDLTVNVSDGTATASRAVSVTISNLNGRVSTRRVATGFSAPLFLTGRGDGSGRVLVVEKGGLVRVLDPLTGVIEAQPFLDVRTQVATDSERGLLGLALAPDFATSGSLYIFMTALNGDLQVRKFTATTTGTGTSTGDIILSIPHPLGNHNGGWIDFDANGLLVVAVGDGGGANDPNGNGQNKNVLLGKMLRIDPRSDSYPADTNRDYAIPAGNPFATSGGAPEVWHWGLRNPFRNSFDRTTGNFYIGDVGQGAVEEIDLVRPTDPGFNFGWVLREGSQVLSNPTATGLTAPVAEYYHGTGPLQGGSLTGGYVYRGPVVAMRGHYVFGDFVNRRIWSILASSMVQGTTITSANALFVDRTTAFAPAAGAIGSITSFGEDEFGNIYVIDYDGEIFLIDEVDEA